MYFSSLLLSSLLSPSLLQQSAVKTCPVSKQPYPPAHQPTHEPFLGVPGPPAEGSAQNPVQLD